MVSGRYKSKGSATDPHGAGGSRAVHSHCSKPLHLHYPFSFSFFFLWGGGGRSYFLSNCFCSSQFRITSLVSECITGGSGLIV